MKCRELLNSWPGTVRWQISARTAAPEGGARYRYRQRFWVRGCIFIALAAPPLAAQDVPSGQSLTLSEVLIDTVESETWLRFRFLAPQIARAGAQVSYDAAQGDFAHLCETVAVPYLAEFDLSADVVVISLMDRPVPFGQSDPQATQFIEVFQLENGLCVVDPLS